jgi:hypothetical protein
MSRVLKRKSEPDGFLEALQRQSGNAVVRDNL